MRPFLILPSLPSLTGDEDKPSYDFENPPPRDVVVRGLIHTATREVIIHFTSPEARKWEGETLAHWVKEVRETAWPLSIRLFGVPPVSTHRREVSPPAGSKARKLAIYIGREPKPESELVSSPECSS